MKYTIQISLIEQLIDCEQVDLFGRGSGAQRVNINPRYGACALYFDPKQKLWHFLSCSKSSPDISADKDILWLSGLNAEHQSLRLINQVYSAGGGLSHWILNTFYENLSIGRKTCTFNDCNILIQYDMRLLVSGWPLCYVPCVRGWHADCDVSLY